MTAPPRWIGTPRFALLLLWLVLGVVLWNGFLDLYISRGAREYFQLQAEFQLGLGPEPAMAEVMTRAKQAGIRAASVWAILITGAGLATTLVAGRHGRTAD